MATTIPAIMAIVNADTSITSGSLGDTGDNAATGRRSIGFGAWDHLPPPPPLTGAQRTSAITALLGGTVATFADVLALVATAAVAPVTQQQIWRLITNGSDSTNG